MAQIQDIIQFAQNTRRTVIKTAHKAGNQGVHIGGALSCVDILAVLYGGILKFDLNDRLSETRDRLIFSKGHDCLALYSALCESGFFSLEELYQNFLHDGGFLPTHPIRNLEKGIEFSSGSLGQGLGFAIGEALSSKLKSINNRVYVIMGDGECNEGSCWEAFMAAKQYELDNITLYIDKNGFQSDGKTQDIMDIDLNQALSSLGWNTYIVDGHNCSEILDATLLSMHYAGKPSAIIANTIKGKGVSFMEGNNKWHHGFMSEEQYQQAIEELNI